MQQEAIALGMKPQEWYRQQPRLTYCLAIEAMDKFRVEKVSIIFPNLQA